MPSGPAAGPGIVSAVPIGSNGGSPSFVGAGSNNIALYGHEQGGRPGSGTAVLRPSAPSGGGGGGGPWDTWYPWYSTGFYWGTGYYYYDPWMYGGWVYGRYGMWPYDPYYDPYGYAAAVGAYGSAGSSTYSPWREKGSVRLRIDPATAQVYVDGVLQGSVDDFDGLGSHLQLDEGDHLLEVKAAGYETYSTQITVPAGKTVTYRASLKKKK
jgi:hypothetical protein